MRQRRAPRKRSHSPVAPLLAFSHQCQLLVYLPFLVPSTDPAPGSRRPQAPLLRQPCPKAVPGQTPGRPHSNSGRSNSIRRATGSKAVDTAAQGHGEECQDTPAVKCLWLLGSWHLTHRAAQPQEGEGGQASRLGSHICLALPPQAKGCWEEVAESLAPGLSGSCGTDREGQALHRSGHAPGSRGGPRIGCQF